MCHGASPTFKPLKSHPNASLVQWPFKWSQKLRRKISVNLSFRKSAPLSETSGTRRIRAHEHEPDDWECKASPSTTATHSGELTHTQHSVVLQPVTSGCSYYSAAESFESVPSICRCEQDETAHGPSLNLPHSLSPYEITSCKNNTQTQVKDGLCIPAVQDCDPPDSPALRSTEVLDAKHRDLWESFLQLSEQSRWLAASEKLRQVEDAGICGENWVTAPGVSAQQGAKQEVNEMLQALKSFDDSLAETCRYQRSSSQPLQVLFH